MRVLIVIAMLAGAAFLFLFVLADLARDLSGHSFHAPPDLDSSDDGDVAADRSGVRYPASSRVTIDA
jgi:hypothetical protein